MNIKDISVFLKYKSKWPTMEIHNLLDVKSRAELREWLIKNHKTEKECWVVVKRGRPTDDNTFWYIDAVEEALCFGWIDSTTKKIADDVTAQKLLNPAKRKATPIKNEKRFSEQKRKAMKIIKAIPEIVSPLLLHC